MNCSCGGAAGKDAGTRRPAWSQTSIDAGVTSVRASDPLGQPGRAPASMVLEEGAGGGCSCQGATPPGGWIVWLLVSIVAWRLLGGKGGA